LDGALDEEEAHAEVGMTTNMGQAATSLQEKKPIPVRVLDDILTQWGGPSALLGDDGLLKAMTKALVERAMEAELTHHLDYARYGVPPEGQRNRRNGHSAKTLRTTGGPLEIAIPRDREGTFEPRLVPKHQRDFDGFDEKILSMYARGSSVRDIRNSVKEM
jgi:transposase-like protein